MAYVRQRDWTVKCPRCGARFELSECPAPGGMAYNIETCPECGEDVLLEERRKGIQHAYMVSHKVTITYRRVVWAVNKAEAEALAADMGDVGADDQATETEWKAKRIQPKKGEAPEQVYTDEYRKWAEGGYKGLPPDEPAGISKDFLLNTRIEIRRQITKEVKENERR